MNDGRPRPAAGVGSLAIVLHSHMPYVEGFGTYPFGEEWLFVLAGHLGSHDDSDPKRDRRFSAVRHIADLYDRYAVHRPSMILSWAEGDDLDGDGAVRFSLSDPRIGGDTTWGRYAKAVVQAFGEAGVPVREDPALAAAITDWTNAIAAQNSTK